MSQLWPQIYRSLTAAAAPLVRTYLGRRRRRGREDSGRFAERFGWAGEARPDGPLLWVHAASVGEARSVLALAWRILDERPGLELLLTTGTVASARLFAGSLPPRARHQFVPVDIPSAVERFLDHWRPGLALWVESELWPNLVLGTARRGIPMVLVNGRLSAGARTRWRALPGLIRPMLRAFVLCLTQDERQAVRFRELGAAGVVCVGDLKAAAPPLTADPRQVAELRRQVGDRPLWLAASTHEGEEAAVAEAHARIARDHQRLLTIVAPRHPGRGLAINDMLRRRGLRTARRGAGEPITPDSNAYLADTLGELGLFFRLAGIAFIGGSLVAQGGHNPFEAARLGCVVLHGPNVANCAAMTAALDAAGGALPVADAGGLAATVSRLLGDPAERDRRAAAAAQVAAAGDGVLDAVLARLAPLLDALAPTVPATLAQQPHPPAAGPATAAAAIDADACS